MMDRLPELLAPAGSLDKLQAALAYGADAVYVGGQGLSMRPDSASFSVEDLARAVAETHRQGRRLYVAVNSLLMDDQLDALEAWVEATRDLPLDAVIVSDAGAVEILRTQRPDLRLHISTQQSTANPRAVAFWQRNGASRVVLARECTLEQTAAMARRAGIEIEIFVHGAMCVAYSGRCLLSAHLCGKNGSMGECKHACRWEWQLVEQQRPGQSLPVFETGRETIFLGSTDLCLIEHLPTLVQSGVASLKIEGRMKSAYHVANVTRVYRAALDRYAEDPKGWTCDPRWVEELESVSHRPYGTGFAFGYPPDRPDALQSNSRPISRCDLAALVLEQRPGGLLVEAKSVMRPGDTLEWIGPGMTDGVLTVTGVADEQHQAREQTVAGYRAWVDLAGDAALPPHAMLRSRKEP